MRKMLVIGMLIACMLPTVKAVPTCNTSMSQDCYHINIANNLAGVISGGDVEIYVSYLKNVAETTSLVHASIIIDAPQTTTPVLTTTTTVQSGCTIGSPQTLTTSSAQYFDSSTAFNITMSDTECTALIEAKLVGGAVVTTIFDLYLPINIASNDAPQNVYHYTCNNTGSMSVNFNATTTVCNQMTQNNTLSGTISVAQSGSWQIDNQNRLCASSALGSACTTPLLNLTGTVAQSQSGTWQVDNTNRLCASSALGSSCTTPSMNGDILNRLCLASTIGSACNTPLISVAQSGTWQLDNTNRLCAASVLGSSCTTPTVNTPLSGTVAVTQSGTWQIDNENRLCASSAFGASCSTPSVNGDFLDRLCNASAIGASCAVPNVNVHQDQACGATIQCQNTLMNGNMTNNNQFNITTTVVPTVFETLTGMTGIEFLFMIGTVFVCIIIWSRSQDYLIQTMMMFVMFVPALIWLNLWASKHLKSSILLAMLTFMLALYLGLRTAVDNFTERKVKKSQS